MAALAKNGRNESLTPSRASKSSFACCRRLAIRVTSASTTVVSWALTCSDSTMRRAMTARRRDIFSVRPRTEVSGVAAGDGVPAGGRRSRRPRRGAAGLLGGGEHVLLADPATDAAAGDRREVDAALGGQPADQRRHVAAASRRRSDAGACCRGPAAAAG